MEDLTVNTTTTDKADVQPQISSVEMDEYLELQSDERLREITLIAMAILENRTCARRRDAIAEIQRLAKENGLTVNVKRPARKRGHTSKKAAAQTSTK